MALPGVRFRWKRRRSLAALSLLCLVALAAAWRPAANAEDLSGPPPAPADTPALPPYTAEELRDFLRRADELQLASAPEWLTLLHWDGRRSRVDDPAFFLAPDGKRDARAELRANLEAFLAPAPEAGPAAADRFPARLEWLCERLAIERGRLPVPACAELEAAMQSLEPRQAVVVFPSAYLNTPASMFGHTLVTIRGRRRSELMNQAVNYAASVPADTNGIVFAVKGIFGGYPGYYSLMPYYKKVQEYGDMEQRDVWEYELTFDTREIRRLLLHVWELRNMRSDYYFFGENCSYNLLFLLDVARPGLNLTERFGGVRFWVVPLDTVKAMREAGLIAGVAYRPSLATRVRRDAARLSAEEAETVRRIGAGELAPEAVAADAQRPAATAGALLDLSAAYLQSLRGRKKIVQEEYQPRYFRILSARSRLPPAEETPADAPAPPRPDEGHASGRLTLGVGSDEGRDFLEVSCRAAYHDILDPGAGYVPGFEIQFARLDLRWEEVREQLRLQRLDAIRLRSLSPRDRFYRPLSWQLGTGVARERVGHEGRGVYAAYLDGGPGATWTLGGGSLLYTLLGGALRLGGLDRGGALGAGPEAGILVPVGTRWHLHAYGRWTHFVAGDTAANWEVGLEQRWTVARNLALSLHLARRETWGFLGDEAAVKLLLYF
jgi:hypothetical protein